MKSGLVVFFVAVVLLSGCNERSHVVDPATLPQAAQGQVIGDTSYIQLQPIWSNFYKPKGITVGFDYILYVAEPDSNRIEMVELSGMKVGVSRYVKNPVAIAEDRRFNLIIACEYDTSVSGQTVSLASIAKIRLFDYQHNISAAPVEIVHHEPVQRQIVRDAAGNLVSGREYTGVAVLPDNSYYVTRHGNSNTSPVDPDNMILHFSEQDFQYSNDYINLVPRMLPTGTGFAAIDQLSGITTFRTRQFGTDFIVTQVDPANAFKVKWVSYTPGSEIVAPGWNSKLSLDPTKYTAGVLPDLLSSIFISPTAVMVDDRSSIYVVDSQLDSLMKFDLTGKLLHESFGPVKTGGALSDPSGLAYYNKIVYISDTGHNRILRYELSTDFR